MLLGTLFALGCAFCWLFANVTIRPAARRYGALRALIWAQLVAFPISVLAAVLLDGAPGDWNARGLLALAVAAIAALLAYGGLFFALDRGRLSVVAPVISAWSALSVVIGLVFFDESLSPLRGFAIALVFGSNLTLATLEGRAGRTKTSSEQSSSPSALWAAAASCLGFGVMVPAVKVLGEEIGPAWAVPAVWSAELLLAMVALGLAGQLRPRPESWRGWWQAGRPGLFEVAGFLLISLAIAPGRAPVAVAGPVSSLSTALSVVWGMALLKERLPPLAILAAGGASLGVVLVNF